MLRANFLKRVKVEPVSSFLFAVARVSLAGPDVCLCLTAPTQWLTAMLRFRSELGGRVIAVDGLKLNWPWALFAWWLAYDTRAPKVCVSAVTAGQAVLLARPAHDLKQPQTRAGTEPPCNRVAPSETVALSASASDPRVTSTSVVRSSKLRGQGDDTPGPTDPVVRDNLGDPVPITAAELDVIDSHFDQLLTDLLTPARAASEPKT